MEELACERDTGWCMPSKFAIMAATSSMATLQLLGQQLFDASSIIYATNRPIGMKQLGV